MNFNRLDDVSAWLTGNGDLIFSNEPDKVYKAVIIEGLNYTKAGLFSNRKRFSVDFECEPFKYSINANEDYFYITTPGTIFGRGTYQSEPVITVYGSGDIDLDINSTNIDEALTVLVKKDILNGTEYWLNAVKCVKFLDGLLIKFANYANKVG